MDCCLFDCVFISRLISICNTIFLNVGMKWNQLNAFFCVTAESRLLRDTAINKFRIFNKQLNNFELLCQKMLTSDSSESVLAGLLV